MTLEVGAIVEGKISKITNFGAFVNMGDSGIGLVHISEVSNSFVKDIRENLKEDQMVNVKVLEIKNDGKVELSIKRAQSPEKNEEHFASNKPKAFENRRRDASVNSFEQLLSNFNKTSAEKLSSSFFEQPTKQRRNFNRRNK